MPRDIKDAQIANPLHGAVSGRQGTNVPVLEQDNFSIMRDVVPKAVGIFTGVMNTANEAAFKEGQADRAADAEHMSGAVDQTAALVAARSWLTRDAYEQGVKLQDFTETQFDVQQRIAQQASDSAEAGDSVEMFSNKIKVHMSRLNDKIHNSGMQGVARAAAQDQLLGYITASQEKYQSNLEAVTKDNNAKAAAKDNAAGVSTFAASSPAGAPIVLQNIWTMNSQRGLMLNRGEANLEASKLQAAAIESILEKANPTNRADVEKINHISAWMDSEGNTMDSAITEKIRGTIDKKMQQVRYMSDMNYGTAINRLQENFAATKQLDLDGINRTTAELTSAVLNEELTPKQAKAHFNTLSRLKVQANADAGKRPGWTVGMNPKQRAAVGVSDTEAATDAMAQIATNRPAGEVGNIAIHMGALTGNDKLIESGTKFMLKGFMPSINTYSASELANMDNTDAEVQFKALQTVFRGSVGKPALQQKLIASMPQGVERTALFNLLASNDVDGIPDLAGRYQQEKDAVTLAQAEGASFKVKFTKDWAREQQSVLGQTFNKGSSQIGYEPSEENLEIATRRIQTHYDQHADYLRTRGWHITNQDMAALALRSEGLLISMPQGEVPITPTAKGMFSGSVNGQYSDAKVSAVLVSLGQRLALDLGPNAQNQSLYGMVTRGFYSLTNPLSSGIDVDQVQYTVADAGVTVQAYTNEGTPIPGAKRFYPYGEVQAIAQKPMETTEAGNLAAQVGGELGKDPATPFVFGDVQREMGVMEGIRNDYIKGLEVKPLVIDQVMSGQPGERRVVEIYPDTGTFGGSNLVKAAIVKRIVRDEGFLSQPDATDKDRPDVITVGYGTRKQTYVDMFGESKYNEFVAAAANGRDDPKFMKMNDEFTSKFFQVHDLQGMLATAGEPALSPEVVESPVAVALATTSWHGPKSAWVLAKAIKHVRDGGEIDAAYAAVQSTKAYRDAGDKRAREMLDALESVAP